MSDLILAGVIVLAVILVFKLFSLPIRWFFRLLLSTVSGFVFLLLINFIGAYIGISIGINILYALIIGVFGLPGLVLLLVVNILR